MGLRVGPPAGLRTRRLRPQSPPSKFLSRQWWRNAFLLRHIKSLVETFHFRKQFMSRNLAEPVADARLCCARAPAHRHVAPRRPGSELLTWQRLRCPKGSCIGKRGEVRWWVRYHSTHKARKAAIRELRRAVHRRRTAGGARRARIWPTGLRSAQRRVDRPRRSVGGETPFSVDQDRGIIR